jgi:hypothetical protein
VLLKSEVSFDSESTTNVSVNSSASAAFGSLRGDVNMTRSTDTYRTERVTTDLFGAFSADFQDTLHINGPASVPFTLKFSLFADYSFFHTGTGGFQPSLAEDLSNPFCTLSPTNVTSATISLGCTAGGLSNVNLNFGIGGHLGGFLIPGTPLPTPTDPDFPDFAQDFAELDASNTAKFYVDVLTPGFTLSSDSGHDYSTSATPEGSSSAQVCIGLGFAVMLLCLRRGEDDDAVSKRFGR